MLYAGEDVHWKRERERDILLARALSRTSREGHHVSVHLAEFLSTDQPTLRTERFGVMEDVRVMVVDVCGGADYGLRSRNLLLWSVREVYWKEQALTPGAIRCPQRTAPVEGTTRGKRPGVPEEMRRDSLITLCRYGSFSNLALLIHTSLFGIASRSSACSFPSTRGSLRALYVAIVRT